MGKSIKFLILLLAAKYSYGKDIFEISGIWVNSEYLNLVLDSKSPKSGSTLISQTEFPAYLVTNSKEKEIELDLNFHEGGELQYENYNSGNFKISKNTEFDSLKFKNQTLNLYKNNNFRKYEKISDDTGNVEIATTKKLSNKIFSKIYSCNDDVKIMANSDTIQIGKKKYNFVFVFDYVEFLPLDVILIYEGKKQIEKFGFVGNGEFWTFYKLKDEDHIIGDLAYKCIPAEYKRP